MDEVMIKAYLSKNILAKMKEANINMKQLAKLTKIPESTLSRCVNGQNMSNFYHIIKIADVFNCSIDDLINRESVYREPVIVYDDIQNGYL